jgi:hypothetical protein
MLRVQQVTTFASVVVCVRDEHRVCVYIGSVYIVGVSTVDVTV